jgi:hypothetical protein
MGWCAMALPQAEEAEVSELESSMRSTLSVTFMENTNTYRMDLKFDGLCYSIHFSKTHGGGRQEGVALNFLKEDLYTWISKDPMFNPGGMYGICFYAHEARNCPKWVRKFANCFA